MSGKKRILLTGVGAPGVQGTLFALRQLDVHITGTDTNEEAVGRYLCDAFAVIPPARDTNAYLEAMLSLCTTQEIAVVVPQNTAELLVLAEHKADFVAIGTHVLISSKEAIEHANNKFNLLEEARQLGIPTGRYTLCSTFKQLEREVAERRTRGENVVVKPPCGNGSRGVRVIIDPNQRDRKHDFYTQKPSALYCTIDELHDILGDEFPELLVMDYLEGDEYTVDVLRTKTHFLALPRKRESMQSGITFRASLEQNEAIITACRQLADTIGLEYCFGFQFKKDAHGKPVLLECNPRVQGTMVMSALAGGNIIAASVLDVLGEPILPMEIDWNTRLIRYWGAIGINESTMVKI